MFGGINAYIGLVETQGRGGLHLHMLLWLHGAPGPERLQELFRCTEFRERVANFIRTNFSASLTGVRSRSDLDHIPADSAIAYNRPPNPSSNLFEEQLLEIEQNVAQTKQIHTCTSATCLRLDHSGRLACKRRAPWPLSEEVIVNEDGTWLIQWEYAYANGWVRCIT